MSFVLYEVQNGEVFSLRIEGKGIEKFLEAPTPFLLGKKCREKGIKIGFEDLRTPLFLGQSTEDGAKKYGVNIGKVTEFKKGYSEAP